MPGILKGQGGQCGQSEETRRVRAAGDEVENVTEHTLPRASGPLSLVVMLVMLPETWSLSVLTVTARLLGPHAALE